jgi:hypothetical protein
VRGDGRKRFQLSNASLLRVAKARSRSSIVGYTTRLGSQPMALLSCDYGDPTTHYSSEVQSCIHAWGIYSLIR